MFEAKENICAYLLLDGLGFPDNHVYEQSSWNSDEHFAIRDKVRLSNMFKIFNFSSVGRPPRLGHIKPALVNMSDRIGVTTVFLNLFTKICIVSESS